MAKFQYLTISSSNGYLSDRDLAKYGEQGWELVSVTPLLTGGNIGDCSYGYLIEQTNHSFVYFFKKEV